MWSPKLKIKDQQTWQFTTAFTKIVQKSIGLVSSSHVVQNQNKISTNMDGNLPLHSLSKILQQVTGKNKDHCHFVTFA